MFSYWIQKNNERIVVRVPQIMGKDQQGHDGSSSAKVLVTRWLLGFGGGDVQFIGERLEIWKKHQGNQYHGV